MFRGDNMIRSEVPPDAVEKKLKTSGVEGLQVGIAGFAQKRQRDAEKFVMIHLQASPKPGTRMQILGQFRQRYGQIIEFVLIQK